MQLLKTMLWMNNVSRHFLVMTGRAGARHSPVNDDGLAVRLGFRIVASGTRRVTVRPCELIALPRIVIEQGRFPFLFGVTTGAIRGAGRGKLAGVLIFMAARALLGRGIKNNRAPIGLLHVGLMAPFAGHLAMAPLENKTGPGVIETGQLRPGYRVVAGATVAGGAVPPGCAIRAANWPRCRSLWQVEQVRLSKRNLSTTGVVAFRLWWQSWQTTAP